MLDLSNAPLNLSHNLALIWKNLINPIICQIWHKRNGSLIYQEAGFCTHVCSTSLSRVFFTEYHSPIIFRYHFTKYVKVAFTTAAVLPVFRCLLRKFATILQCIWREKKLFCIHLAKMLYWMPLFFFFFFFLAICMWPNLFLTTLYRNKQTNKTKTKQPNKNWAQCMRQQWVYILSTHACRFVRHPLSPYSALLLMVENRS